jgi:hypothetical protein
MTGCQTAGGSAAAGGGIGAGLGAIIGHQSGHAGEGALIGLGVGALTGLIVHDVKARRQRTAQETAQQYEYTPAQGQRLTFEHARVEPYRTYRGERVEATAQFALLGAGPGVQLTESWILRDDRQEIAQLSSYTQTREDGTWVSTLPFRVPENLAPGNYYIAYHAQTSQAGISGRADFVVQ